jgi:hypothetical protein
MENVRPLKGLQKFDSFQSFVEQQNLICGKMHTSENKFVDIFISNSIILKFGKFQ